MPAPKCEPGCSCGKHFVSDEARAKMRAAVKNKPPRTPASRIAWSAKMKQKWADPEFRMRTSAAMRGRKQTPEHTAKRAIGQANYFRSQPMNRLEQFVYDHALADFAEVQREVAFGPYVVDFYIPSHHIAFEVDGVWHQLPEYHESNQRRDAWLLAELNLPVVRLTEREINERIGDSALTVVIAGVKSAHE